MSSLNHALAIATRQGGILLRAQALEVGMTGAQIRHRIERGDWKILQRGIYEVLPVEADWKGWLRAAVAKLPDAVVSHRSAARLHDVPFVRLEFPEVTVHASTTHVFPGVQVHRSLDLLTEHRTEVDGLPVTSLPRTVVDLAGPLRRRQTQWVLEELIAAKRTSLEEVSAVVEDVARRGRPGSQALREILQELEAAPDGGRASRLERRALRFFSEHGFPEPEWQYPAPWNPESEWIDFAWPRWRTGCECDSRRWHTRSRDFERDRRRDRKGLISGWRILRVTWEDLNDRPGEVAAELWAALQLGGYTGD